MTYNLLSMFDNFGQKVLTGGFTFLLGICVVFLGMIILVLAVSAVGKAMTKAEEKKVSKKAVEVEKEVETFTLDTSDEIPEHVKVAIVAAIAAYYADSGVKNEFKVKKIKRI